MPHPTFKSPCERLRYRAMRDGEGSASDRAWRQHAAGCKECQASLHIMELLQGNADSQEAALPQEKLDALMRRVELRYGPRELQARRRRGLGLLWRVGIVAGVVFVAGHFASLEWALEKSVGSVTGTIAMTAAAKGDAPAPLATLAAPEEHAEFEEFLPMAAEMDDSIEDVRSQIDNQFNELNELIDHDLNDY